MDMIMPHATILPLSACAVPLVPDGPEIWIFACPTVYVTTLMGAYIGAKAVQTKPGKIRRASSFS
jgi:hypothetical protein